MKPKISEITFQPFKIFGEILEEIFAGYAVRKPCGDNDRDIDLNLNYHCDLLHLNENGVFYAGIFYVISRDRFLYLKPGGTWVEIQLSDEEGMIIIRLYCAEKINVKGPVPMTNEYEPRIPITKLEDPGIINRLKLFLDSNFADTKALKEWITENISGVLGYGIHKSFHDLTYGTFKISSEYTLSFFFKKIPDCSGTFYVCLLYFIMVDGQVVESNFYTSIFTEYKQFILKNKDIIRAIYAYMGFFHKGRLAELSSVQLMKGGDYNL